MTPKGRTAWHEQEIHRTLGARSVLMNSFSENGAMQSAQGNKDPTDEDQGESDQAVQLAAVF